MNLRNAAYFTDRGLEVFIRNRFVRDGGRSLLFQVEGTDLDCVWVFGTPKDATPELQEPPMDGFAVRLTGAAAKARLSLQPTRPLGVLTGQDETHGYPVHATMDPDRYLAGPWVLTQFQAGAVEARVVSWNAYVDGLRDLVAAKDSRRLATRIARLRQAALPEAEAAARRAEAALAEVQAPFEARADAELARILRGVRTKAFADAWTLLDGVGKLAEAQTGYDGRRLTSSRTWLERARSTWAERIEAERAAADPATQPIRYAYLSAMADPSQWGAGRRLGRLYTALVTAPDLGQLVKRASTLRFYRKGDDAVRRLARALEQAAAEKIRSECGRAAAAAPEESLSRLAFLELEKSRGCEDFTGLDLILTDLVLVERATELAHFVPWFERCRNRLADETPRLHAAVEGRARSLAIRKFKEARRQGRPLTAAGMLLWVTAIESKAWPAPTTIEATLAAVGKPRADGAPVGSAIEQARELVAPALLEVLPLSSSEGRLIDLTLNSRHTRFWPVRRKLGVDFGHNAGLWEVANPEVPGAPRRQELQLFGEDFTLRSAPRRAIRWMGLDTVTMHLLGARALSSSEREANAKFTARRAELGTGLAAVQESGERHEQEIEHYRQDSDVFVRRVKSGALRGAAAKAAERELIARGEKLEARRKALTAEANQFNEEIAAFNQELRVYLDDLHERRGTRVQTVYQRLASSVDRYLDERITAWGQGKEASEVDWMRWFLGRPREGFTGVPLRLPVADQVLERDVDEDEVAIFRAGGRRETGAALGRFWEQLHGRKHPERVGRVRRALERYRKSYGNDAVFTYVVMRCKPSEVFVAEILDEEEQKVVRQKASETMKQYRDHLRKRAHPRASK